MCTDLCCFASFFIWFLLMLAAGVSNGWELAPSLTFAGGNLFVLASLPAASAWLAGAALAPAGPTGCCCALAPSSCMTAAAGSSSPAVTKKKEKRNSTTFVVLEGTSALAEQCLTLFNGKVLKRPCPAGRC